MTIVVDSEMFPLHSVLLAQAKYKNYHSKLQKKDN